MKCQPLEPGIQVHGRSTRLVPKGVKAHVGPLRLPFEGNRPTMLGQAIWKGSLRVQVDRTEYPTSPTTWFFETRLQQSTPLPMRPPAVLSSVQSERAKDLRIEPQILALISISRSILGLPSQLTWKCTDPCRKTTSPLKDDFPLG